MSIAALIRRMADAGAPAEAIALAVEAIENAQAKDAERRANAAERKARQRERQSRDSHVTVTTLSRDNLSPKEKSPTPPKEITPIPISEARASSIETRAGFADFWAIFPNKVGKRDAEAAFSKALKRADLDTILAGVRRYAAKTDDRPWCNPATFLNQDRWNDQPAANSTAPPKPRTVGDIFRDDAKRMGLIPNDKPPGTIDGHLETGNGSRESGGTGISRRFAIPADVLGRLG